MSDWEEGSLQDIAEIEMGQSPKGHTCNREGVGTPLLNGPTEFGIKNPEAIQFTTDAKKYSVPNDILFCVRGSTTGRMNWSDKKYAIGRGLAAIRHKKGIKYKYFLRAVIEYNLPVLLNSATGSTFPNVSKSQLEGLKINIPPLSEQESISSILSSLDQKLNLLYNQNITLELIAGNLFRHWFVDPSDDSWETHRIKEYVIHLKNSVSPSSNPDVLFSHYSIPAYDNGGEPNLELGSEIRSSKYQVTSNTILVSKLNPRFPRVWPIYGSVEPNSICSTEFQVFKPKNLDVFPFLYYLFKSDAVTSELEMAASGTSGSHQRVRPSVMLNVEFSIPNKNKAIEFSGIIRPSLEKINQNKTQMQTLEKLRNTLLSKLISGDIKVT
ncbi:restriction endonuclease subunit S [Phaeodactylibacter sp.]|uniref:restriction endonuclease subunit S n=1 Tax=Phaeodactylibacter sp. TaxID=1940289 RepID=UPI0025CF0C4A|nr:restriction endonuclease subunit S [Phaeodactylibacter sp.]MCI5091174.1 restriction endonuclease subunit S [Phaeodactylibacter sp.]